MLRLVVFLTAACPIFGFLGCGSGGSHSSSKPRDSSPSRLAQGMPPPAPVGLVARRLARLPRAVGGLAAASPDDRSALFMGGLGVTGSSVAGVEAITASRARSAGSLPAPLHDGAAAAVGGLVYFFGGGDVGSSSAILRVEVPGRAMRAGSLPAAASDVAAATIGNTAYVVGGFTGTRALNTVVAWRPGARATVVARLPRPLRYAGVAAAGQRLMISGGTSGLAARREVFSFDPGTGAVTQIALLPRPLTHAGAATLHGVVYVIGGRGSDLSSQRSEVLAINPRSGAVTRAGALPGGLSDAGVTTVGNRILIAGGVDAAGSTRAEVLEMTPRR